MMTQLNLEEYLGSLEEHLIFHVQHYMMILYTPPLFFCSRNLWEENWK
jgi:hypothetical protein